MRGSEPAGATPRRPSPARLAWLAIVAAACSTRVLVPIAPCGDAGGPGCGPSTPTGILNDLVGYWHLDDGPGSMMARDVSGNANDGMLFDLDPTTAWVSGRSGGALDFNGAGWVGVRRSASIDAIVEHVTITAWIYFDGVVKPDPGQTNVGWGTALSREQGSTIYQHYHLALTIEGRPSSFIEPETGSFNAKAPTPVAREAWTHIAVVYDGQEVRLFVAGTLVANVPATGSFLPDMTPVIIGGNGNDASGVPTELFPGRLDEIMLYNRALSNDEVRKLAEGVLFPGGVPRDSGASD